MLRRTTVTAGIMENSFLVNKWSISKLVESCIDLRNSFSRRAGHVNLLNDLSNVIYKGSRVEIAHNVELL